MIPLSHTWSPWLGLVSHNCHRAPSLNRVWVLLHVCSVLQGFPVVWWRCCNQAHRTSLLQSCKWWLGPKGNYVVCFSCYTWETAAPVFLAVLDRCWGAYVSGQWCHCLILMLSEVPWYDREPIRLLSFSPVYIVLPALDRRGSWQGSGLSE